MNTNAVPSSFAAFKESKPAVFTASAVIASATAALSSLTTVASLPTSPQTETAAETESEEVDDQAAADEVAALIDAIYVQTRNENTDEQCAAAVSVCGCVVSVSFLLPHPVKRAAVIVNARTSASVFYCLFP